MTNSSDVVTLMPAEIDKMLYWYGYINSSIESCNNLNGWTAPIAGNGVRYTFIEPIFQNNNITFRTGSHDLKLSGVGTKSKIPIKNTYAIASVSRQYGTPNNSLTSALRIKQNKNLETIDTDGLSFAPSEQEVLNKLYLYTASYQDTQTMNVYISAWNHEEGEFYALWYD